MGLYIKDILLPEDPNEIIEFAVKGDGKVFVVGEHYWPDAVEVPEPHGRLINADEFLKRAIGTKCFRGDFALMLEELVGESTTIIPASGTEVE